MKKLDNKDCEITLMIKYITILLFFFFHLMCMHLVYLKIDKVWDLSLIAVERLMQSCDYTVIVWLNHLVWREKNYPWKLNKKGVLIYEEHTSQYYL